ncbi:MAG: C40 family peptidase, partial [Acidobacteria bacterium]|nr:C40 family peptidase [Acidobacteriota bacterium]
MHRPILCGFVASLVALVPPAVAQATESVHHDPLPVVISSPGLAPDPGLESRRDTASPLIRTALRFLGAPYLFGGTSPRGFDCSGYVQAVFAEIGVRLPRMADE